jgi:hypothetical protein
MFKEVPMNRHGEDDVPFQSICTPADYLGSLCSTSRISQVVPTPGTSIARVPDDGMECTLSMLMAKGEYCRRAELAAGLVEAAV